MADDGSKQSTATWPLVKFSFSVSFLDGNEVIFQEVTGLSTETQVIEYRGGSSPIYSTVKMPGIQKFGNVTFKKGIFVKDNGFWASYSQIKMNTIKRSTIVIKLLDESGAPTMTWTLANAFPCKISGTDMKSDANEVAIETMEVAHEGLTIANA